MIAILGQPPNSLQKSHKKEKSDNYCSVGDAPRGEGAAPTKSPVSTSFGNDCLELFR
jgi:hypothetical protein